MKHIYLINYTKLYRRLATVFLLSLLLCACGRNIPAEDGKESEATGEAISQEGSAAEDLEPIPLTPIGPVTEPTLESLRADADRSYANVCDSYAKMQDLAAAPDASEKGKQAAAAVEEKHAGRIQELADADFSQMSLEELRDLTADLANLITAIREARDALTLE